MLKKYNREAATGILAAGEEPTEEGGLPPEQKAQMKEFVKNGTEIIKQAGPSILQAITKQDPIDGIAQEMIKVWERLENMALDAGEKLYPMAMLLASMKIMSAIVELYEQQGKQLTDEQEYQALSLFLATYLDNAVKSGKITKEELQELSQMVQDGAVKSGTMKPEQLEQMRAMMSDQQPQQQPQQPIEPQQPGLLGRP